jgi:hypothetical protein
MNILKRLTLLIIFLMVTGCATVGPTIVIETPEPAEDFVVLCTKSKSHFIGHNASSYSAVDHVIVTESGKEVDCGLMLGGKRGNALILHPTLTGDGKSNYEKDGVEYIVFNKTKLDVLDEKKAKFEEGYWDRYKNPGFKYANNLTGCGFPHQYFNYYSEVKNVDVEHFKKLYHKPMLECKKRTFSILKLYRPVASSSLPSAETWMEQMWQSDAWGRYK